MAAAQMPTYYHQPGGVKGGSAEQFNFAKPRAILGIPLRNLDSDEKD